MKTASLVLQSKKDNTHTNSMGTSWNKKQTKQNTTNKTLTRRKSKTNFEPTLSPKTLEVHENSVFKTNRNTETEFSKRQKDTNKKQTKTNKNKQKQTETNRNKQKQTETNRNKQKQTKTNKNKQKQTKTNKQKKKKNKQTTTKQTQKHKTNNT